MQTDHKTNGGRGASLSRRNFLQVAKLATCSAGLAAAVPAAAEAGGCANLHTLPLSDEQQLDACIGQLRNILARMHPRSTINHLHYLASRPDGSYRLSLQGDVEFGCYDGPGLYEISIDGHPAAWWLEQDCHRSATTGNPIPGLQFYHAQYWEDGAPTDEWRRFTLPNIMRKLKGGAA